MGKKKFVFAALGAAVLALILGTVLLPRTGQKPHTPTAPAVQTRPAETQEPDQVIPTESKMTEPAQTLPAETMPAETEPVETEPYATTEPDESVEPESEPTLPAETEPIQTQPAETEPTQTQPAATEPTQTQPAEPEPTRPVETEPTTAPTEAPEIFPMQLEDGMLTVESVFQYSGMNPDAELEFGENIAGLQLVNTSGVHLTMAELTVLLDDGSALTFLAEDVAPGMTVMAFSLEQGVLDDPKQCVDVYGYAEFEDGDPLRSDLVKIQVEGVEITVENVSGMDLTNLDIVCHGLLDGSAFGGRAYTYRINSLASGGSTTVYALDCILGMTQVTRVELDE